MLVLTRKENEEITIGDNIVLKIVEIGGGKVRIGVQAPREVPIVRGDAIKREPKSESSGIVCEGRKDC